MKRLNIIEKSRGIPNLLKDSATSCMGLMEDKSTIHVKVTRDEKTAVIQT